MTSEIVQSHDETTYYQDGNAILFTDGEGNRGSADTRPGTVPTVPTFLSADGVLVVAISADKRR